MAEVIKFFWHNTSCFVVRSEDKPLRLINLPADFSFFDNFHEGFYSCLTQLKKLILLVIANEKLSRLAHLFI
jgi:hypothetical protein